MTRKIDSSDISREPFEMMKVLVDGGYAEESFAASVTKILGAAVEVAQRNELHQFAVIPPNVGQSSVPSPGWRNVGGFGTTANAGSQPIGSSSYRPFWHCCYEDIEQVLGNI